MKIAARSNQGPRNNPLTGPYPSEKSRVTQDQLSGLLESFLKDLKDLSPRFEDLSQYPLVIKLINKNLPEIYREYDKFISLELDSLVDGITCKKTCSGCCNHFVASVEPFELLFIDHSLKSNPEYSSLIYQLSLRHQSFDKLAGQARKYNEDQVLFEYLKKEISCPFLSAEQTCTIYRKRPVPCRMFFSQSHPSLCLGIKTIHPDNKNFLIELADDVEVQISRVSLWFEELELPNLFFPGLLKVNEVFGSYA